MNRTLFAYRLSLTFFIAGLVFSGLTAFPLPQEASLLCRWFGVSDPTAYASLPGIQGWIGFVKVGLDRTYATFPFFGYGTDWLAFGHFAIASLFIGPWRDPVRNDWVLRCGLVCCAAVIPFTLICGQVRQIPFSWRLLDCSFGIIGAIPLLYCLSLTRKLARGGETN